MFDHLLVGEAQDGDALTAEEGVAESITSLSRGVGRAVHLDGQFGFDAKEVGEVVADGELSTELEAVDLSAAQNLRYACNPPIHQGSPPHESEGGWGGE